MKLQTGASAVVLILLAGTAAVCYLLMRPSPDTGVMRIEISKSLRELAFHDGSGGVRKYRIALGFQPAGPKEVEGDGATPEGAYSVCCKNPLSKYTLSLGISYPGPRDADRGLSNGLITTEEHSQITQAAAESRTPPWKTPLGGEIFIHGGGTGSDWTAGCIALSDAEISELYDLVPLGTPVIIRP